MFVCSFGLFIYFNHLTMFANVANLRILWTEKLSQMEHCNNVLCAHTCVFNLGNPLRRVLRNQRIEKLRDA